MQYQLFSHASPVLLVIIALFGASFLITTFSMWNIFVKTGRSGIWAFVPIYNIVVLCQISKVSLWYMILFLVPIFNFVMLFALKYKLSKAFGYDLEFAVGLFFLPFIFMPILAFGRSQYVLNEAIIERVPETPESVV